MVGWVAGAAAVVAVLCGGGAVGQTDLRIGLHAQLSTASDDVASFLLAVREINGNPGLHLGDPTLRLVPFAEDATFQEHEVRAMNAMGSLASAPPCFFEGGGEGDAHDAHVVVSGRGSSSAVRASPIAAMANKPVVGYAATSDDLSASVGRRLSRLLLL